VFRDKAAMKAAAVAAGLAAPAICPVDTLAELMDFAARHSPLVVKPVDGAGAKDVVVLPDRAAVEHWAGGVALRSDEQPRLVAEEWIDAPMLSVDGLMAAGTVRAAMVGRYTETCLDSVRFGRPNGILQLDADSPTARAANAYVAALVAALPTPDELTSFHAELFELPTGPVLCEIACRTGGGYLDRIAVEAFGVGLDHASCLGQAGAAPDLRPQTAGRGVFGDLLIPRPAGVLTHAPDACPVPGVVHFAVRARVGDACTRATKVSECAADALLRADNHAELLRTYDQVVGWLDRELRWA
jgi:biotin carboxylase